MVQSEDVISADNVANYDYESYDREVERQYIENERTFTSMESVVSTEIDNLASVIDIVGSSDHKAPVRKKMPFAALSKNKPSNDHDRVDNDVYSADIKQVVEHNSFEYDSNNYDDSRRLFIGKVVGVVPPDELCNPEAAKFMHSLLEIQKRDSKQLVLVPFVPHIVVHVDISNGVVLIDPPDGLLDLTYEEFKRVVIRGLLPENAIGLTTTERLELEHMSRRFTR